MDDIRALLGHARHAEISTRRYPVGKRGKRTAMCYTRRGRVLPGLHRTIQRRWYPRYRAVRRQGGACSSKATGSLVDRQLTQYAQCGRVCPRANKYTRMAVEFFKANKIRLVAGQVMIFSENKHWATAIDLIGVRDGARGKDSEFILIEVKTGYAVGASKSQGKLEAPLIAVPNTQEAHHHLQLLMMDELLHREYSTPVHKAIILYLQEDAKTKRVTAFARPYPAWCRTRKQRREIWDAL